MPNSHSDSDDALVVALTVQWLECAVIGLNLCPFAKAVHTKGQVHYVVTRARSEAELLELLRRELMALQQTPVQVRETSLMMVVGLFDEFLLFNDFLSRADKLLRQCDLEGDIQIASFHPQFQFAGAGKDDISNFSNRAPYPTLHLLREQSIDRAVAVFPQAEQIFEKNMQTLARLGPQGWNALGLPVRANRSGEGPKNAKN